MCRYQMIVWLRYGRAEQVPRYGSRAIGRLPALKFALEERSTVQGTIRMSERGLIIKNYGDTNPEQRWPIQEQVKDR